LSATTEMENALKLVKAILEAFTSTDIGMVQAVLFFRLLWIHAVVLLSSHSHTHTAVNTILLNPTIEILKTARLSAKIQSKLIQSANN